MLTEVDTAVKKPYKIRIEVRRGHSESSKYTVTLVSRWSLALRPVVDALRGDGLEPSLVYVDRYGYLRVVYKNLTPELKEKVREAAKRHIASVRDTAKQERHAVFAL